MATNPSQRNPPPGRSVAHDGLGTWLLGALGLLWIGGMAARALRVERTGMPGSQPGGFSGGPEGIERGALWRGRVAQKPTRGYETRDANAKWVLRIVLSLFVFGLAVHGIIAGFLVLLKGTTPPTDRWRSDRPASRPGSVPQPFPVLQVSPPQDLQAFRARESAELESYGWINRTSGIVRIPIERAMDLVLKEGLPVRSGPGADQTGISTYELIRQQAEHREQEIAP